MCDASGYALWKPASHGLNKPERVIQAPYARWLTFPFSCEGQNVVPIFIFQGLLLQIVEQPLSIIGSCGFLPRLVFLSHASWQQCILEEKDKGTKIAVIILAGIDLANLFTINNKRHFHSSQALHKEINKQILGCLRGTFA